MQQFSLFPNIPEPTPTPSRFSCLRYYAVIEPGGHAVIWGIGKNRREAIDDAFKETSGHKDMLIDDLDDLINALEDQELIVIRCSRKLFKAVGELGGNINFIYKPNVGVYLPEELENAKQYKKQDGRP